MERSSDNDLEQALAALSGLFALGAFLLRQWGNFHRQSLIHQKQLTDNIYYRNINNNSGIFTYLIGEAEEQECKEALLAYYCLIMANRSRSRARRSVRRSRSSCCSVSASPPISTSTRPCRS